MTDRTRILVTGGAKGVGEAIVRAMAAGGHDVVFTYRTSADQARALAEDVAAANPGATIEPRPLDLADKEAVEAFCEAVEGESWLGFVHNAGQSYDALAAMMAQDKAEAAMQVNFFAFARLCKALMRPMLRARAGRIVAIGSVAATQANAGNAAYAATKGALAAYARTLAMETAKRGVTVNVIAPGFVDTDMLAPYAPYRESMEKQIPAGRFCKPEEVAGLAAFLMTPPAAYVTGATIPIDGGLSAMLGIHR
ncbi:SDR family NAD(P)-dependent oxidoreductase [Salinarimonas sp. NSM]|uniref:SDR family NAD(P)-dependent oxidoreductase n=1 Tax=Salinarimonas sp. NSM TaxID=3458003 RepID=UPI0040371CED